MAPQAAGSLDSVPSNDARCLSSFERTCAALTHAKMVREAKTARGSSMSFSEVQDELVLVDQALKTCNSDEQRVVLAEFWDECDEVLLSSVVASAAAASDTPLDKRLPAPGEVVEWQSAAVEVRDTICAIKEEAGWSMPWPVVDVQYTPALPTPCRTPARAAAPQQHIAESGHAVSSTSPPAPASAPKAAPVASFRTASSLLPQQPPQEKPAQPPQESSDFDGVSKSILSKRNGSSSKSKSGGEEKGREWGEEWLRIADAEQLERIVPALEATIHRASGADSLTRNDIAGLEFVKTQIEEVLILPQLHPQLFASALTRPARGLLLFGPPGTGKTLLARWIAAECGATFFNINASSVLSKWIGEAEKTVKALFQLAAERQPSVIFIDEIDSLLSQRRDADNESSRRVKNEFLTSLEGADTASQDKILLVGATNMPWELDPAALRRLPKRLYVPLPGCASRLSLLQRQLSKHNEKSGLASVMEPSQIADVAARTEGLSGSDLQALLNEAAMGPVREASAALGPLRKRAAPGATPAVLEPRNINMKDFENALRRVKPSFNDEQAVKHREFNDEHGTCRGDDAMQDSEDLLDVSGSQAAACP